MCRCFSHKIYYRKHLFWFQPMKFMNRINKVKLKYWMWKNSFTNMENYGIFCAIPLQKGVTEVLSSHVAILSGLKNVYKGRITIFPSRIYPDQLLILKFIWPNTRPLHINSPSYLCSSNCNSTLSGLSRTIVHQRAYAALSKS